MQSQHMTDVWNIFDRGKPFPWSFRGQRQKKLIDILKRQHPAEAKKVKELIDDDHAKINKELRCIVSPILGQGNEELKLELSSWVIKDEPPPINESGSRVNLGILWTHLWRSRNGSEEIYDRADYRVFASGRGDDRAWMHD